MLATTFNSLQQWLRPWLVGGLGVLLSCTAFAGELDWVNRAEMQKLPAALQRDIPEWCNGVYYTPQFANPPSERHTIIEADNASYTSDGLALLSGNVSILQPERHLFADQATLNQETGEFSLLGDIKLDGASESFNARELTGNINSEQNQLEQVRYAIFSRHARGEARYVSREGDITYIRQGSYTTCEPGQKGWKLAARHISLDKQKGWGTARDITLEVKDVPVLYLPWMTFPIDDRRKTGLLFPTFTNTDDGGIDYTQPIYLNLHPQLDAVIAPRFINGRGTGAETQTRYLTKIGGGLVDYAYINKDRKFDNETRSMASWKHNGRYGNWSYNTDVNYASDDFYFKDLGTATLEMVSQTQLPRTAQVSYSQPTWRFSTQIQSWQIIDPSLSQTNYPYRRLPRMILTAQPGINGPFRFNWESEYSYFDRGVNLPNGSLTGSRFHIQPALSLPLVKSWGYLTPRIRSYTTYYDLHGLQTLQDNNPRRTLVGSNVDAGLFFERQLTLGNNAYLQTLEPRLFYNYIPYHQQDDLQRFDTILPPFSYTSLFKENRFLGYDRIGDENKLAAGLTSRLLSNQTGQEIWRVRIGEGLYFKDRRVSLRPNQPINRVRNTPIVADSTFHLNQRWNIYAEKQWDNGTDLGKQDILRLGYNHPARRYGHIGFRKVESGASTVRQGEVAGMWPISQHWSLMASELFDFDSRRSVESVSGIEYRDCCWKLRLINRRLLADYEGDSKLTARRTVMFQIQLIGLGGFGDKVDTLLENTIPGYRREDQ